MFKVYYRLTMAVHLSFFSTLKVCMSSVKYNNKKLIVLDTILFWQFSRATSRGLPHEPTKRKINTQCSTLALLLPHMQT